MVTGVAPSTRTLALKLSKNAHEVLVVTSSNKNHSKIEIDQNYKIIRIKSVVVPFQKNLRLTLSLERTFKKIINDFKPDVVHVQTLFSTGLVALYVAHRLGIPTVATNHVMPNNITKNVMLLEPVSGLFEKIFTRYGMLLYHDADYIVMPTQSAIDMFRIKSDNISPVSNGIDLGRFYPHTPNKRIIGKYRIPNKPVVTYVGRLDGEKDIDVLIWAAEIISQKHDVHFLLVGDGKVKKDLQKLVKKLDLGKRFTFTGRVSDRELEELQNVGSVFAMPSPTELQSLATLEAMACGKPIVAVDAGALPEICQDGANGLIVESKNILEMADKISMLLSDKKLAQKYGDKSQEIAKTHDIKHIVKKIEQIYSSLINQ